MTPNITTHGITSNNSDVKLTVLAGGLSVGATADAGADDITLGSGNLTLNVDRKSTEEGSNVILASGLQLLGSGTVHLDDSGNNVSTLAASTSGPISYTDSNALVVGTVTDTAMTPNTTTHGITSNNSDVKLTVLAGGLSVGATADAGADDITLGSGNLTLNVDRKSTEEGSNVILASGLQLLGSGTVHLDDSGNNVSTLAASTSGPISYTDSNALVVGTVTDTAMTPNTTTHGITSNNSDVKLTVLAGGLSVGATADAGADDITLGSGNLTLNVDRKSTEEGSNVILASGLQLLGSGTVHLDDSGNNVSTLAASTSGPISYTDSNALVVGTVTDTAMTPNTTTHGITSNNSDVKLTVLAGGLSVGATADAGADDITLGSGNLTLNVDRKSTEEGSNVILASGLQLLGSGTVHLDDSGNNVSTLAASTSGPISYTDSNALVVGTVTDTAMTPNTTTHGITSNNSDVKLTVLAGGLSVGAAADAGADDITLGTGNLTLNVSGNVSQVDRKSVLYGKLELLGSGSVHPDDSGNNVATLAASTSGPISYTDASAPAVGTVTDTAMTPNSTTHAITTTNSDVKLTVLAGGLTIGATADAGADDITLGTGNLTLNVSGNVSQ